VPTSELLHEGSLQTLRIQRMFVDGVVRAPFGAHFTSAHRIILATKNFRSCTRRRQGQGRTGWLRRTLCLAEERGRLSRGGDVTMSEVARHEYCAVAIADALLAAVSCW